MTTINIADMIAAVGSVASSIVLISSAFALIFKPIRKHLTKHFKNDDVNKKIDDLKDAFDTYTKQDNEDTLCLIRHTILEIYYTYRNEPALPHYEKENLIELYDTYRRKGGNHYIEQLYNELISKPEKQ